jgi:hypothetical protein
MRVLSITEESGDGESYVSRVLIRSLSHSGDLILYLWPLRCLKSQMGGPAFSIDWV